MRVHGAPTSLSVAARRGRLGRWKRASEDECRSREGGGRGPGDSGAWGGGGPFGAGLRPDRLEAARSHYLMRPQGQVSTRGEGAIKASRARTSPSRDRRTSPYRGTEWPVSFSSARQVTRQASVAFLVSCGWPALPLPRQPRPCHGVSRQQFEITQHICRIDRALAPPTCIAAVVRLSPPAYPLAPPNHALSHRRSRTAPDPTRYPTTSARYTPVSQETLSM